VNLLEWTIASGPVMFHLNNIFMRAMAKNRVNPPIHIAMEIQDKKLVVSLVFATQGESISAQDHLREAFEKEGMPWGAGHPYQIQFMHDSKTPTRWKLMWEDARDTLEEREYSEAEAAKEAEGSQP